MSILQIGAEEVRERLSMSQCIDLMERAMCAVSSGQFDAPLRRISSLDGGHFFLMPGAMVEGPVFGAKMVSLLPGNPQRGLPAVQGFIALFDHRTGSPLALVDGASVTCLRTAATSAMATRVLARTGATSHGIFGAGVLAMEHLQSISSIRDISQTRVWARDTAKAVEFAERAAEETGIVVETTGPEEAAACDIVSVVTNASEPVLRGRWLRPGSHVNLVGAHEPQHREADSDAVSTARIYVDTLIGALKESGDILIPINEGRMGKNAVIGEIGQVLTGSAQGRRDEMEITLFKSLGHVAQDLFAAEALYRHAVESRRGTTQAV